MLEGIITLAYYGFGIGGGAGNLFFRLEQLGFFSYVLPFLMIFAIVFAILDKTGILGDKKGINVILSLAVGLMALQFNFVSYFFAEIFPRMGIVLSIIFVGLILLGLFFDFKDEDGNKTLASKIFGGVIIVAVIVIIVQSLGSFAGFGGFGSGWMISYWLERNLATIIVFALIAGAIIAIISSGNSDNKEETALEKLLKKQKKK